MSNRRSGIWPLMVIVVLIAALIWRFTSDGRWRHERAQGEPREVTERGPLSPEEQANMDLFQQASPSVVHITTLARFANPFTLDITEQPQGTGSGLIWDTAGNIVTNFHVISDADAAQVTLADHSSWQAKLVGAAPDKDLAVLRIEAPSNKLKPIPVGSSKDLGVGQKVFAIGNPFGFDQTLTTGIISALGRMIQAQRTGRTIRDVIQTDAAINPGNSGGPLLDNSGRLIGVNAAIFSPSGAYAGIGFAIPVDTVNWVVPELIDHGRIIRPDLGVQVANEALTRGELPGLLILDVPPGSKADEAGLRPTRRLRSGAVQLGDIIVEIDGKKIESTDDMMSLLELKQVGDTVDVTVLRDGRRVQLKVKLVEAESE